MASAASDLIASVLAIALTAERLTETLFVLFAGLAGLCSYKRKRKTLRIALGRSNKKKYAKKLDSFPRVAGARPPANVSAARYDGENAGILDGKITADGNTVVVDTLDFCCFECCGGVEASTIYVVPDDDLPEGVQERGNLWLKGIMTSYAKQVVAMILAVPIAFGIAYGSLNDSTDRWVVGAVAGFLAPYAHQLINMGFKYNEEAAWVKKVEGAEAKGKEEGKKESEDAAKAEGKMEGSKDVLQRLQAHDNVAYNAFIAVPAVANLVHQHVQWDAAQVQLKAARLQNRPVRIVVCDACIDLENRSNEARITSSRPNSSF